MKLAAGVLVLLLAALASTAHAQPVTITISQPAEATTMDPGRSTQVLTVNYFYNLYDTLTRWDTALRLGAGLATAWKSVNETTWEFTLRQGVRFHDGSPFSAEDVKATQIIHDEKPWLELFQEVIVYGVSRRVSFKPRPDYRLIVSEMAASR